MAKKTSEAGWSLKTSDQSQTPAITESASPEKQHIQFVLEKRKKGKVVTLLRNFTLSDADIKDLARDLKNACGTGGTSRAGEIELQGDCRDRARTFLKQKGYGLK